MVLVYGGFPCLLRKEIKLKNFMSFILYFFMVPPACNVSLVFLYLSSMFFFFCGDEFTNLLVNKFSSKYSPAPSDSVCPYIYN